MSQTTKIVFQWIITLAIILPLAVVFIPLFYAGFIMLLLVCPPLLFINGFFEDREEYRVRTLKHAIKLFFSLFVLFPLFLLTIIAILRSITLAAFSFYPPVLNEFNHMHHELFYRFFIPKFGELFPYWLDVYWGILAVCSIFIMSIMDSIRRNMLFRQIENLPTSKVHAAAIGLVELKGKAVPIDKTTNGSIMRSWIEHVPDGGVTSRTYAAPFYLDDGTGQVLVDPEGCDVDAEDRIFEIKLHHAILKQYTPKTGFPEGRLMPGDEVYVLGNLQINNDPEDKENQVIIKPKKSSYTRLNFYDLFFVSNTTEEELLEKLKNSVNRGWAGVLLMMAITAWFAIYAWTNILQLKHLELEAAPAIFRLVTTPTALERKFSVADLGAHPTIYWLELLKQGHSEGREIMQALEEQSLGKLAVPILTKQAMDIEHPAFGLANHWLRRLKAIPEGHWGFEYWNTEYIDEYLETDQTFIYRVILNYQRPVLYAGYRAYFGEVKSDHLELSKRYVVFDFTSKETDIIKHMEFFSNEGWNKADNVLVFEHFLPGEYSFDIYAKRQYRGGPQDKGSRKRKAIDVFF